jgi:hypothetical protein
LDIQQAITAFEAHVSDCLVVHRSNIEELPEVFDEAQMTALKSDKRGRGLSEVRWKRCFQMLFPDATEVEVPSPCMCRSKPQPVRIIVN